MRVHVGTWLRDAREKKGWTRQELAEQLHLTQRTVSKVETGKWSITVDRLSLFCHHLGIDLKKMFKHGKL